MMLNTVLFPTSHGTMPKTSCDHPLLAFPPSAAQQAGLLEQSNRLAWSSGNVNELLVAGECRNMGLLLQEFYKHCSFLPLGFAGLAGEALESGQYRWASGEELLRQIRLLSSANQQEPPPELQALYFKTVVYIPLENGAAVLEIGTKELVPKSESAGMIYQILRLINELATQGTSRGDQTTRSSFELGTKALPHDTGNRYGDPDEQYKIPSMMEIYGDGAKLRHPSNTSSYWSSTSTSSSTRSVSDQMGNNSNTTFALNTSPAQVSSMNNEDMLMSPASSLQATPKSMVNRFDDLHILHQLDQIGMPISLPDFDSYWPNNDDHHHISALHLNFSSRNVSASPPLLSLSNNSQYLDHQSEPNHSQLLDCVLDPMQCAFSARNDAKIDAHHCLNEIVRGPFKAANMAFQTEVTSISCLPSVTCQASSHSASLSNDHLQHQPWRGMFPSNNEGDQKMNDLFGKSKGHVHAIVIPNSPLAGSLGDKRLEANIDQGIMQEQGTALRTEKEGSTCRNRRLIMGISSTNSEGHEAFIDDKKCNDQGEKVVVSSTVTSTTLAAGSYVSYASGSAEAEKVAALSSYIGAGGLIIGSGNRDDHYEVQQQLQGRQQDDQYIAGTPHESNVNFASSVSPAQVHHMHAERKRRRKQSDCINTLRTLLPNITKKDKVTILQSTIQYLQELKDRICELEQQEKISPMSSNIISFNHDQRKSQHAAACTSYNVKNIRTSAHEENATFLYWTGEAGKMPHFRLSLIKGAVQDVNVNATISDIVNALQQKNLHCYEINSEFCKDTSKISLNIFANHKDGANYSPTLDDIQNMEQWWKHLA